MMRSVCLFIGLTLAASAGAAERASGNPDGRPLQDLYYGDVLFHYFQDDAFGALTRLMAARELGRAQALAPDSEVLRGGMLLSLGQVEDALTVFQSALQTESRKDVRNRLWLETGRALHQHGDDAAALKAFQNIEGPLPGDLEADRQMLTGEILISAGRFDEAAAQLQAWKGTRDWMTFAHFNLGVAMIRAGRNADGENELEMLDKEDLGSEEQLALLDRANTALGYTHLRDKQWDAARTDLRRVRLKGPSATRALLGLGWAESGLGHDNDALLPWRELARRDASDLAVQEGLLALPYALARTGSIESATSHYESAIGIFEQQSQRIDELTTKVQQPDFIDRLLNPEINAAAAGADAPRHRIALAAHLPGDVEYHDLSALIASEKFQAGLRNCQELLQIQQRFANWKQRIDDPSAPESRALASSLGRIQALEVLTADTVQRQKQALTELATAELEHRRQRLIDYQAEARFGLAHLLDRSAGARPASPMAKPAPGKQP